MNGINDIRLDQFLQMKKEIRGSEQYLIVGIDAAKEKHRAFFGTAQGRPLLKILVFDNTLEGFEKLDAYVDASTFNTARRRLFSASSLQLITTSPWRSILIKCGRRWSFLLAAWR